MTGPQLVVASSYGPAGASSRVRVLDWLRFLGLEAEVWNYIGTSNVRPRTLVRHPLEVIGAEVHLRQLSRRPPPERLFLSRSMGPFTGGRIEARLLRRAGWGVYDFDDAIFAADRTGIHKLFGQAAGWAPAVENADLVIAGNSYLAEAAADLNSNVEVIPSCVDPSAYPQKRDYAIGAVPRLIWMGSPSTEGYLEAIAPALLEVHRVTGARLTVVSAGERPLGDLDSMTDRVAWRGTATDALLADADCGIMPLPDTPFTRGKCAYKLLQYGAAALPAVASPIGVNAQVLRDLQGFSATDADSWVDAVLALLQEPESARRARGVAARRAVEDGYSFTAWRPAFLRALRLPDDDPATPVDQESPAEPRR